MKTEKSKIMELLDSPNMDNQKLGVSLANDILGWKVETIVEYIFDIIDNRKAWEIIKEENKVYFGIESLEITYKRFFFNIPLIQRFEDSENIKSMYYNCSFSDQITEAINDFL